MMLIFFNIETLRDIMYIYTVLLLFFGKQEFRIYENINNLYLYSLFTNIKCN